MLHATEPQLPGDPTDQVALAHSRSGCCASAGDPMRELLARDGLVLGEWRCLGSRDTRATQGVTVKAHEIIVTRQGAYARHVGRAPSRVMSYAGVATFSNPGDEYAVSHPLPGGDVCSVFRLGETVFRDLLAATAPKLAEMATPRFPITDVTIESCAYLRHRMAILAACSSAATTSIESMAAEEWATDFLGTVMRQAAQLRANDGRTPEHGNRYAAEYAARVREIIARRFREPLTLHEIARAVGASPFHLSRVIRAHEGMPIHQLIIRLRLRVALEQALNTRDSLMAIALDAGFSSHSHFGDAFRREFGCSPGAVRRLAQRRAAALPLEVSDAAARH
jgi:AraC family transcriptional regulator